MHYNGTQIAQMKRIYTDFNAETKECKRKLEVRHSESLTCVTLKTQFNEIQKSVLIKFLRRDLRTKN